MLSFAKTFSTFPSRLPGSLPHRLIHPIILTRSSIDNGNDTDTSPPVQPPIITPPDTVEIRFKRGSRRRRKQEEETSNMPLKKKSPPKEWDSMTLTEKAIELYVGEKGLLFWLNKFAYASIYIIIGGWILFRFAGPALNLYQLDTPPLAPTDVFKGK
ncbi:hypothetical protein ACJIZ3_019623 [Penstemon smallii]|uniref:Transmembrane protein n=1 Tax=Penstemon smallii TaxID=265156 RepID=A0ABD3T2F5_9LAMI